MLSVPDDDDDDDDDDNKITFYCPSGKDHVCRFVGCGRNDRFNYVVMELQVGKDVNYY